MKNFKQTALLVFLTLIVPMALMGQNWTGKFKLVKDYSVDNSFILQVVPDNSGDDEIAASGTVAYLILPLNTSFTSVNLNANWTTTTLATVPGEGSPPCGDLVQSTMESDLEMSFVAGQPVDLIRYTLVSEGDCPLGHGVRIMEDNASGNEPCDAIDAGFLDNGLQTGSNSAAYTGNLTGFGNPLTCEDILPIELISFSAKKEAESSYLSWKTANELNNEIFFIEHSIDGKLFKTIGKVDGNGTTAHIHNYEFIHQKPQGGANYYRLKQVDYDGQYSFSPIRLVNFSKNVSLDVSVFPSLFTDRVSIVFNENIADLGSLSLEVYSQDGRKVYDDKILSDPGAEVSVDLSMLHPGMYYYKVVNSQSVAASGKLVKY